MRVHVERARGKAPDAEVQLILIATYSRKTNAMHAW